VSHSMGERDTAAVSQDSRCDQAPAYGKAASSAHTHEAVRAVAQALLAGWPVDQLLSHRARS
jgi:hypothetical protein